MKYCNKCGAPLEDNNQFCAACGAKQPNPRKQEPAGMPEKKASETFEAPVQGSEAPFTAVPPQYAPPSFSTPPQPEPPQYATPYYSTPSQPAQTQASKPKAGGGRKALIIAVVAILVLAAGIGGYLLFFQKGKDLPDIGYSYLSAEEKIDLTYNAVNTIYPTMYGSMDSIINFTATCEGGEAPVLVKVEIPGFTQPYEQLVTLSGQITQIYVRPPILPGDLSLDTQKDAQITFTVTNQDTGKYVLQETLPVTIMSKYDFKLWDDEFGVCTFDNLLAWLTPESDAITQLQREAVDWLNSYTGGQINSLGGYQNIGGFSDDSLYLNTYYQALAIQAALGDASQVRYNSSAFSMGGDDIQRIKLPDDVLATKSGICIETSLTVASALQSAGMHAMIIILPGHAQVAVETWENSGEYFLIETTLLPVAADNINYVVTYLDNSQWDAYINDPYGDGNGCYVLDCDLASTFGISAFSS